MDLGEKRSLFSSVLDLLNSRDCLNIKNIRTEYLKYMLIFPLAPVFANLQTAIFSDLPDFMGLDPMTLMGSAYCIGAGSLFAISKPEKMGRLSKLIASFTFAAFILWMVMPEGFINLMFAILFSAGLGGCAAFAAFSYTFLLNNTERFAGAALISLFFSVNQLDYGFSFISGRFPRFYLTALVIGSTICLFSYRAEDFSEIETDSSGDWTEFTKPLLLTLYFFIAHYFVEIFYTYLPGASSRSSVIANGVTGIIVVITAAALMLSSRRSVWNMCSIFFLAVIMTYGLYFSPDGSFLRTLARYLHGFEQMGYIAAYYLLGCIFKKHGDFSTFRLALITVLPLSMAAYVIPGIIQARNPEALPYAATAFSVMAFIVFIMLSPSYFRHIFFSEWSDDLHCKDMKEKKEEEDQPCLLENCGLSPREKEIAALLLQGEITKSIAEKLNISVHTVNFHIKNLYRKLEIGNRAELFARFSSDEGKTGR